MSRRALTQRSEERTRSALRERLEARRDEIEAAALTRVRAIADPNEAGDPSYVEGLRSAVSAAIEYALEAIGHGGERGPPPPVRLLAQARLAARSGVSLDTVLRRYFAGYSLLSYFVVEEVGRESLMGPAEIKRLLATQSSLFDRLMAAIGEEYANESGTQLRSADQRQAERIVRLLEGELIDTADIAYDFAGWHLGTVASGPRAQEAIRALAEPRDCRLLSVGRDNEVAWGWLGTRASPDTLELECLRSSSVSTGAVLALGEPAEGLVGWRITHRQATAALPVAVRAGQSPVRYAEVALLAAVIQDDLHANSLRQIYLGPLAGQRDGGAALRETLRAYLAVNRGLASTAAAINVSPRTIGKRLRKVEELLGRPLQAVLTDLDVALQLDELDHRAS